MGSYEDGSLAVGTAWVLIKAPPGGTAVIQTLLLTRNLYYSAHYVTARKMACFSTITVKIARIDPKRTLCGQTLSSIR